MFKARNKAERTEAALDVRRGLREVLRCAMFRKLFTRRKSLILSTALHAVFLLVLFHALPPRGAQPEPVQTISIEIVALAEALPEPVPEPVPEAEPELVPEPVPEAATEPVPELEPRSDEAVPPAGAALRAAERPEAPERPTETAADIPRQVSQSPGTVARGEGRTRTAVRTETVASPASASGGDRGDRGAATAERAQSGQSRPPRSPAAVPGDVRILKIQQRLSAAGFDPGPLDGQVGPQTLTAFAAYQQNATDADGGDAAAALLAALDLDLPDIGPDCAGAPRPYSTRGEGGYDGPMTQGLTEYFAAMEAQHRGKPNEAIALYTRSLETQDLPAAFLAYAHNNRGAAFKRIGKYGAAIADYDAALKLDPLYTPAYYNRAIARHVQADLPSAIEDYSAALGLDPDHAHAYNNRAMAFEQAGQNRRAIADLSQAIRLAPCLDYAYFNRGRLYERRGDLARAVVDFKRAYALKPATRAYSGKLKELGLL